MWDGEDSDSDSSDTSLSSSDEEDSVRHWRKKEKRRQRVSRVKNRMPGSLVNRLEKSSIGKRLEEYVEKGKQDPVKPSPSTGGNIPPAPDKAAGEKKDCTPEPAVVEEKRTNPLSCLIQPRVLHGYTLTREVSFRDVCLAIRNDAFTASDLPLIVSLEVHCSPEQQEIMVATMEETWKGYLLPPPEHEYKDLPAPGDLRRKILVKVKYAPPNSQAAGPSKPAADTEADKSDEERLPAGTPPKKKSQHASKIIQALSKLGIYTRGVSFKGLSQPEATMPGHIFSLSEKTVMEVHEKQGKELFRHNRNFLMRTYPSGLRIRSSNLDPLTFWERGIQVVALNWQNWDEGMMLNEGMFAGSGGYVLKPPGKWLIELCCF